MLERVEEQQAVICAVLAENRDRSIWSLLPENEKWGIVVDLIGILKPFCDGTTIMSGSKYPTFSVVTPLLYKLLKVTLKVVDNDNDLTKCIKRSISGDLLTRYDSCD